MTIPISYLRECFNMNPETGILTWKKRPRCHFSSNSGCNTFNSQHPGKEAGSMGNQDYIQVSLAYQGKRHVLRAHRIIWAMHYNRWPYPHLELDHYPNRDKTCNAISNLREVNHSENNHNKGLRSDNTTGIKGVSVQKMGKNTYWGAKLKNNGQVYNKCFPYTEAGKQEAIAQRKAWEKEYIV